MSDRARKDLRRARAMTAKLAKEHYENFLVSSIFLPRRMRQPFFDVYAYCRTADDAADESGDRSTARHHLSVLRESLDQTYSGHPPNDLFLALEDTVNRFEIPKQPFADLLDAFEQDQAVSRYPNEAALLDYCRRSANPVGRIVLRMADADDEENNRLSDEICTALQLVNFWQDIARDYVLGRVYVPLDRWAGAGISPAILDHLPAGSDTPPAMRAMVLQLCDEVDERMDRGASLVHQVPKWLAKSLKLFIGGGRATAAAIRRIDGDVLRVRPTVSKWKQARMVLSGCLLPSALDRGLRRHREA